MKVPKDYKTVATSNCSMIAASRLMTRPLRLYLKYRHLLNAINGPDAAETNALLFVTGTGRSIDSTLLPAMRRLGCRHCSISALGPHICRYGRSSRATCAACAACAACMCMQQLMLCVFVAG